MHASSFPSLLGVRLPLLLPGMLLQLVPADSVKTRELPAIPEG